MDPRPKLDQAPRLGVWLVGLFADGEEREQMVGDLVEEYRERSAGAGPTAARRWYWRQVFGSLPYLVGSQFRTSPWRIASAVAVGFGFQKVGARLVGPAMFAFIDRYNISENHFGVYRFLASTGLDIAHLITFLMVGSLVALVAKKREMAPALTLGVIYAGMTVVASAFFLFKSHEFAYLPTRLSWYFSDALAVAMGALVVRTLRGNGRRLATQTL